VIDTMRHLESEGYEVTYLMPEQVAWWIWRNSRLPAPRHHSCLVMLVNNEIG